MNDLIPVTLTAPAAQTMSSIDIAELTGKRHDHVMRDIRTMLVELHGEDRLPSFGETVERLNPSGGSAIKSPVFKLPKRETLILVSGYNLQMRAKIIDRWQELEERAKNPIAALSRADILRLALDSEEKRVALEGEKLALEHKVEVLAPKAAALDQISAGTDTLTFTQASKVLSLKRDPMIMRMHAEHWIYRQNGSWLAYDHAIRSGLLVYKEANYTDDKTGLAGRKPYCHITPKGLVKLAKIFAVELDREGEPA